MNLRSCPPVATWTPLPPDPPTAQPPWPALPVRLASKLCLDCSFQIFSLIGVATASSCVWVWPGAEQAPAHRCYLEAAGVQHGRKGSVDVREEVEGGSATAWA